MVSTRSASRGGTPASAFAISTPKTPGPGRPSKAFVHAPSPITLGWLLIFLPLVAWDTGYVFGRPHTMPGGWLHKPLWGPYELYGQVDHVYGQKYWESRNGFTAAQSFLNLVEMVMYVTYLGIWYVNGVVAPRHGGKRVLKGRLAGRAVVLCFSAAVMTFSKTLLYWMNEYYSSYDNIGHNDMQTIIFLWMIPNGFWLILPTYMIYSLGSEMVSAIAAEPVKKS